MKILVVFGTRPEAVKMCPLVIRLKREKELECKVCLTGQHREMLEQVMNVFKIRADYNMDIMVEKQSLAMITSSIFNGMEQILDDVNPDLVLVHGDTTTSFATAIVAFYHKIPVGHVEAGLRTHNLFSPFPEEMNRVLTDKISTYFFAPTRMNEENLKKEGVEKNIVVTGNTVIDSFKYTVKNNHVFKNDVLNTIDFNSNRVIVITAHRRENWGMPLENICRAIKCLSSMYKDILFVYPVHLNPVVRSTVFAELSELENVFLIDPVDVVDMHNLLSRSFLILTDSGGIQEEAPYFGKPVLVLRTETERPEAVEAGTVKVVGVNEVEIVDETRRIIDDLGEYNKMANACNPYGNGDACDQIVKFILCINNPCKDQ